jgi:hypothetical protein
MPSLCDIENCDNPIEISYIQTFHLGFEPTKKSPKLISHLCLKCVNKIYRYKNTMVSNERIK